jgi:hypothetical protein
MESILQIRDQDGNIIDIPALQGNDGYTPQKGIDYFDGKDGKDGNDYVLTEADKTEIANTVVALLPKYNGEVVEV